ncbi:MAG: hypothetical protein NVSMB2_09560 [Chloroflexota bacterium]
MQCVDAAERLLASEPGASDQGEFEQHVVSCTACTSVARGLQRLDLIVRSVLVVPPPLDLQRELAQLMLAEAAAPVGGVWWERLAAWLNAAWMPQRVALQGVAVLLVAITGWQVFGALSSVQPVFGDASYAMQLVIASPASTYLSGVHLDVQSLGVWSVVGLIGWALSDDTILSGRLAALRKRLP